MVSVDVKHRVDLLISGFSADGVPNLCARGRNPIACDKEARGRDPQLENSYEKREDKTPNCKTAISYRTPLSFGPGPPTCSATCTRQSRAAYSLL